MNPKQIMIYDTTLRDGTRAEGVHDKIRIAEKLDAFGVHYIEGGWPGSNPKDIAFFDEAKRRTWKTARICDRQVYVYRHVYPHPGYWYAGFWHPGWWF